jgi:ferredoxin
MATEINRQSEGSSSVSRRGFLAVFCVAGAVVALPLARHALSALTSPQEQGLAGPPSPGPAPVIQPAVVPTAAAPEGTGAEQVAAGGKPAVIAAKCVGCGKCVRAAPKTFAMDARTEKAYVKNPTGDSAATIAKAVKVCPTHAIKVE